MTRATGVCEKLITFFLQRFFMHIFLCYEFPNMITSVVKNDRYHMFSVLANTCSPANRRSESETLIFQSFGYEHAVLDWKIVLTTKLKF